MASAKPRYFPGRHGKKFFPLIYPPPLYNFGILLYNEIMLTGELPFLLIK